MHLAFFYWLIMNLEWSGWVVCAFSVLITGISKAGLGGALSGLAVPIMAISVGATNATAIMLPILIFIDFFGFAAWKGKASREEIRLLIPAAILGILAGALTFGLLSENNLKILIGAIAICFVVQKNINGFLNKESKFYDSEMYTKIMGWVGGYTSTVAHAGGTPILAYFLSKNLPKQQFVATIVYYFAIVNLLKVPVYWVLGIFSYENIIVSLLLSPLVPVGVCLGVKLIHILPEHYFYKFASLTLLATGVHLIYGAW